MAILTGSFVDYRPASKINFHNDLKKCCGDGTQILNSTLFNSTFG